MEFGIINFANALILMLILIPNIVYAVKGGQDANSSKRLITIFEQVGRYACMSLMFLPLGVWEFGFPNIFAMLTYLVGNSLLLIAYWIAWGFYFKQKTYSITMILAIAPVGIFLLTGACLRHWLLVAAALLFGCCHIHITRKNEKSPAS